MGTRQNESVNLNNGNGRTTRLYVERRRIPLTEIANIENNFNPRFGVVRDRLFHAMLVRLAVPYHSNVPALLRRFIEFVTLVNAIILLSVLIYTHLLVSNYPAQCLDQVKENWPKKGIVRVEVIRNLEEFREMQARRESLSSERFCHFDRGQIMRTGKLPRELVHYHQHLQTQNQQFEQRRGAPMRQMPAWVDAFIWLLEQFQRFHLAMDEEIVEDDADVVENDGYGMIANDDDDAFFEELPLYHYLFEFSLHYGLLRLNAEMRHELNVDMLVVQLDAEKDKCFEHWRQRPLMRYLVGMDELVMASVKKLSENETTERGYLRDLIGGELYHFVSIGPPSISHYLTAMTIMLIFTFAISMLLRYSHDQIFVFIVDLFQMFELNQPLIFPIAPLLTVILALVGMEAIMSEIFNDTSTAFYVILLVWLADQYDAIFCHTTIGRRHWLRFFYLYHFAFYAYQYRYNGLYSGLALLTSASFTLHSMVFFFHHYELPHLIYQEQLVSAVQFLENTTHPDGEIDIMRIRRITSHEEENNGRGNGPNGPVGGVGASNDAATPNNDEQPSIRIRDRFLLEALSTILNLNTQRNSTTINAMPDPTMPNTSPHQEQTTSSSSSDESQQNGNNEPTAQFVDRVEEAVARSIVDEAIRESEEELRRRNSPSTTKDISPSPALP